MIFEILTLFPEAFDSFLATSILGKAIAQAKIQVHCHNIRDFATGKHRMTDDTPYGGGRGMVMRPEPLLRCLEEVQGSGPKTRVVLLSPQGRLFRQKVAWELTRWPRLILICGRYEGIDERVRTLAVDEEISIGDYVLSGGELAAMIVVEATARLMRGVLGDDQSAKEDSFSGGLLEYPQYTRPRDFMGHSVPDVLLSGDHQAIQAWRRRKSLEQTLAKRPDLLEAARLTEEECQYLNELKQAVKRERQD
jgi:tRNA (guanine37-N1)-methyltransferase